ncbi:hypothetical protein [Pseudomonas aeruginosa]|nr:hypothetical protein [Pseudomonas aeruginosa]HBO7142827.1 hypothetical protein [Pseudomonas aeruginosa]
MITNNSKAPSCTCPSGDGSLVHPCPAHPASVKQAGGDERAAFEAWATHLPMDRQYLRPDLYMPPTQWAWDAWQARAALAQPSPAPTLRAAIDVANDRFEVPVAKWGTDLAGEEERPEVVAWRYGFSGGIVSDKACLDEWKSGGEYQSLMTVAQHERITAQLHDALDESDGDRWKLRSERDAALTKVAELEAKLSDPTAVHQWQFSNAWFDGSEEVVLKSGKEGSPIRTLYAAPVAQAQHSVPELLVRAEDFVSGFEDDDEQEGVSQLLADLRLAIGRAK